MKLKLRSHLLPILFVIAAALYPVMFIYGQNAAEVDFIEVSSVAIAFTSIGIAIYLLSCILLKSPAKASILAASLILYGTNYMLFQKIVNFVFANLKYWHILPIGLFIWGHVLYVLFKYVNEEFLKSITSIGALIMTVLMLINLFPAVPAIIQKTQNSTVSSTTEMNSEQGTQPNIYWIVLDECASFSVIQNHYGYTDTTVRDELSQLGFYISDSSRNESGNTETVLTNCLNLDYVVHSDMSLAELPPYRENPALYEILKSNNYTIQGVGETEWLGGVQSVTVNNSSAGGKTVEGFSAAQLILDNTILSPFMGYDGTADAKIILDAFSYMKDSRNITPNSSTFTLCYLCTPHQPFLFDENGNDVSPANYNNWDDPQYYLNQYIFATNEVLNSIKSILEKDPDCVIVLQSDHGPRFKSGMTFAEQTNILNAVYYRQSNISEIDGMSAVNTWRVLLNKLLNTQLKEVIVPYEG